MSVSTTRRRLLIGSALVLPALALPPRLALADDPAPASAPNAQGALDEYGLPSSAPSAADQAVQDDADKQLAAIEQRMGGRLGVSVLDTETNISLGARETERFALGSTVNALIVGFTLARVDQGAEKLDRRITFSKDAVVAGSPATEAHAGGEGMTVAELCKAAVTAADNTAANLLLDASGGAKALTAWLRSTGDTETRVDRPAPEFDDRKADDPRDTTTPDSMLDTIGLLTLGNTLSDTLRAQLVDWMVSERLADARLRAGLAKDWKVGGIASTGKDGAAADIAVIWPPERGPVLVTAYVADAKLAGAELDAAFADISKIIAGMVG